MSTTVHSSNVQPFRGGRPRGPGRGLLSRIADVVFPPTCAACGAGTGEPEGLCARCWTGLHFIERPFCERLGAPFSVDVGGEILSPAAIAQPPPYGRARAAVVYEGAARSLVHRLKYGDRIDLAETLGRMTARAGRDLLCDADAIVPVPLHRHRLWQRRFNQAAALGRVVSRCSGVPMDVAALRRDKPTATQVGLTRSQRKLNLAGAFVVRTALRPRVAGRRLVLVDDVLTTGSTAEACAKALLRAGAARVDVLAFALVVDES